MWGEGNEEKFRVAEVLRCARLPSESVVYVDSIVTTVMFGRIFPTTPGLSRRIKVLSGNVVDENLDEDNQLRMEELYQAYRRRFEIMGEAAWAAWYMATTADLASKLWDGFEILRRCRKDTLQWFATNFWHWVELHFSPKQQGSPCLLPFVFEVFRRAAQVNKYRKENGVWCGGLSKILQGRVHI